MSQYNKLSDLQYATLHILAVHSHFGLFWSAGIPTIPMPIKILMMLKKYILH